MNSSSFVNGVVFMPDSTNFVIVGGSIVTSIISALVIIRTQKTDSKVGLKSVENEQVKTIFDGYGSIVDDLRNEVLRLREVIDGLQLEQDECLKQNNALVGEIELLKQRINHLEAANGRPHK